MKQIKNNKGETLVESLCALLILSIIMLGLPTLVGEVAELNKRIKKLEASQEIDRSTSTPLDSVTITIEDVKTSTIYSYNDKVMTDYKAYKSGDFYFYEK